MFALALLVLVAVLRVGLMLRQRQVLSGESGAAYAKAVVTQRSLQHLWQLGWALLVLSAALGIGTLEKSAGPTAALFIVVMAGWFWELPAKAYKVFGLDAAHGFNRLTPLRFIREQALRALLFALLALPAAVLAVTALRHHAAIWWLLLWAIGWLGFALLRWGQPRFIAPLFDAVEPLPEGPLRARLQALLTRCGVARQRLFLMRGSARSAQANAQVSGGLGAPRIVLLDTLIDRLKADEIEAVVAHELGHMQRGHLRFQMLMLGAIWLVLMALLALVTVDIPGIAPRLVLAWAMAPSAWLFAQPLANAVYRRFEFEADEAAAQSSSPAAMASALRTLTRNNANATRVDRCYELVYHTHPALAARLARLDRATS